MKSPEELQDADRRPGARPRPDPVSLDARGTRTTESELAFPAWSQLFRLMGRAVRLRCPNCGIGYVLRPYATVNPHCSHCGFRFTRSTDSYFSGAMLTNLAVAEGLFAVIFATVIISAWPNVPWDFLSWAMPLGVAIMPILLFPFAKVAWLSFDVAFRPIQPEEFEATA
jgi:uncharacterized protein (DUF983 family)